MYIICAWCAAIGGGSERTESSTHQEFRVSAAGSSWEKKCLQKNVRMDLIKEGVYAMFCPDCGKDCGEFRFCPNCGVPLGVPCQKGNTETKLVFPKPPVGRYHDIAGYLEINEDGVTFYRNQWPVARRKRRTILFREIYAVSYEEGKSFHSGTLCVRSWQDRHIPLALLPEAVLDETSVYFHKTKNAEFRQLYIFLKHCADIVNSNYPMTGRAALMGKYVGFYGYMELREDAVIIHKKVLWAPATDRILPYSEIAEVAFREARKQNDGGLSIRVRRDQNDVKAALRDAASAENAIDFSAAGNAQMRRVYSFLMEYARKNLERWSQPAE